MTNVLKQAQAMAAMVDWLRDNAQSNGPPSVGPQMGSVADVAAELRDEIFRMANALVASEQDAPDGEVASVDAVRVLRWLEEHEAPPNVVGLQRAVVAALSTSSGAAQSGPSLKIVR